MFGSIRKASAAFLTKANFRHFLASLGISGRFFLLRAGRMTVLLLACFAARTFSFVKVSGVGFTLLENPVFQHGLNRGTNR